MTRAFAALVLGLLAGTAGSSHAQTPTPGTVRGRIVADDTGDAIRNARVSLSDTPAAPVAFTDAEGRFFLTPVASDQRELVAVKTGDVETSVAATDGVQIRLTGSTR